MIIVGERINASRKRIAEAIQGRKAELLQREALQQVGAGASYIEVNAGVFGEGEAIHLAWLVERVQEATLTPLCIDTENPQALATALKRHRGKAIANSITAQKGRYHATVPLLREYGCAVVALCIDDAGIPEAAAERVQIAARLIEDLVADGIALEDIYVDPLVRPISVDCKSALVALHAIEQVKKTCPEVQTICGLSNVSFGLPLRKQINQVFAVMALMKGLDAAILDPCDKRLMANIITASALLGRDEYCLNYIRAYREGRLG